MWQLESKQLCHHERFVGLINKPNAANVSPVSVSPLSKLGVDFPDRTDSWTDGTDMGGFMLNKVG